MASDIESIKRDTVERHPWPTKLLTEASAIPPLRAGTVHLWAVEVPAARDPEAAACRALMSPEERRREQRLRSESQRTTYRWSRALTRGVLSAYGGVDPVDLRLESRPGGKPTIVSPRGNGLDYSLAHTDGVVVLLVGRDRTVGVDVESTRRALPPDLPARLLGPGESRSLRALPAAARSAAFLRHWTLREAYAKARGSGLELPLRDWEFTITEDGVRPRLDPGIEPRPDLWWFGFAAAVPGFVIALAASLRRAGEAAPAVRILPAPAHCG